MKPGLVVSIRISPKDCQSIVALMDASGVSRQGQTFSGMASLALSSLLQTARTAGTIAEPDPFNYWNEVGEYHKGKARDKDKEKIVQAASSKITPITITSTTSAGIASGVVVGAGLSQIGTVLTSDVQYAGMRMKELMVKQEKTPNDWSAADQQEFDQLYKIVYPEG
jgi:hypothetical protein